ncbi:MAG: replication protein RepA [Theionarchaea archaeon]|nr:replication protein RepA [Theionarchaea archaeon]MBU7020334.1 replication protein RepA [Theionarchaea archaeon]MBU7034819.1 replication protein RepA [Theionarchaea archaeon]MBU7040268.1 replication protein RepA [Theionarchaea archaeon]
MKKRAASQRLRLDEVHKGQFVSAEEDFELNYLITEDAQKVYRAKVVATVVSEPYISDDTAYGRIQLDDGFDTITGYVFRETTGLLEHIELGDIVQVIGKIREWQGQKQLTLEAVARVDPNLILLHRLEILKAKQEHDRVLEKAQLIYHEEGEQVRQAKERAKQEGISPDVVEALDELKYLEEREEEPDISKSEIMKNKVLSLIEKHPDGVDMDTILAEFADIYTAEEIEESVRDLLSSGEIFERRINIFVKV